MPENQVINNIQDLPIMLSVPDMAKALHISRAGAYNLVNSEGFPVLKIGKRLLVPKNLFIQWVNKNTKGTFEAAI